MLLQKENNPHLNTITAYGDDYVEINREKHHQSIWFMPEGLVQPLAITSVNNITPDTLRMLAGLDKVKQDPMAFLDGAQPALPADAPEVLLVGTGLRQQMLHPSLTVELLRLRIGVEVMDTPAAARTYNILMSEGRRVVAALLL